MITWPRLFKASKVKANTLNGARTKTGNQCSWFKLLKYILHYSSFLHLSHFYTTLSLKVIYIAPFVMWRAPQASKHVLKKRKKGPFQFHDENRDRETCFPGWWITTWSRLNLDFFPLSLQEAIRRSLHCIEKVCTVYLTREAVAEFESITIKVCKGLYKW